MQRNVLFSIDEGCSILMIIPGLTSTSDPHAWIISTLPILLLRLYFFTSVRIRCQVLSIRSKYNTSSLGNSERPVIV